MISRLEIKGFKSLLDVSIDLGAVNVFIGANGSGKSNLLEAVGVLSAIASGSLDAQSIYDRGIRDGKPASFQSSLLGRPNRTISMAAGDGETTYKLEFGPDEEHPSKWTLFDESIAFEGSEVLRRTTQGAKILVESGFSDFSIANQARFKSVSPFLRLVFAHNKSKFQPDEDSPNIPFLSYDFFDDLKQYAIFSPSTPILRGYNPVSRREPLGFGGEGLDRAITDMVKKDPEKLGPFENQDVFELIDWADSLQTQEDDGSGAIGANGSIRLGIGDRFMDASHKPISLLEASEGALYVLFMLALVGHEESPRLFAVDNFDQALHPRLACALTRLVSNQILADGTRQMLATTHNPLALDGLDLLDDRVRLFTVDRDSMGATQINRVLVSEELMAQADKGLSLSRLWVTGRLGGVPKYL